MDSFPERYRQLNAEQKRAVDTIEGAVLVVAGPGSGKTEILALRVARILQETDAGPTSILCLTFTDAAASNMRARLAGLIGTDAYRVQIGTFHAFAQQVAEQYPAYFSGGASLDPAEAVEQLELVAEAIRALPLRDPLRVEHPSEGLVYLRAAVQRITDLKKAGIDSDTLYRILDHNEALLPRIEEALAPLMQEKVSKKAFRAYAEAADAIRNLPRDAFPLKAYPDLATALARSLEGAIIDAESGDSTEPVSAWKRATLQPKGAGLKSRLQLPKLRSLAQVYRTYQQLLAERGLRDFDDLIVDLVSALRTEPDLRAELQEEYQYILVDEYQDTNGAQAELLALVADSPVAEGNPNLMVVGDDDQAIYRFHGAEISHILGFLERYPKATVVTMTVNYRSHQRILDLARSHIAAAKERLEGRMPGLSKTLTQGGTVADPAIVAIPATTREHERDAVVAVVQERLAAGVPAGEIAVIGRRNRDLDALAPHLAEAGIPVSYERQRDALADRHVVELIETARAAVALAEDPGKADPLLPRVLAFDFWSIPRLALWKLSREAYAQKRPWIDLMRESEEQAIRDAGDLLIEVGLRAKDVSASQLLDELMGTCPTPDGRVSPFRAHYVTPEERAEYPERLLAFVGALRGVLATFAGSRRGSESLLADFVRFADLRREHREPVPTRIPGAAAAVQLLTAHKAKGREFEVVVLLHSATDVWHGRGRGEKIAFPENLPIAPPGDSFDDQLRNLYVAVTRAKRELYLATSPGEGKQQGEPLPLLGELPQRLPPPAKARERLAWQEQAQPVSAGEREALRGLVADFQLGPTQLNDFLDIAHCGPELFFEQHLLRFPQHQTAHMRFGNAMHAVLERLAVRVQQDKPLPDRNETETLVRDHLEAQKFFGKELDEHLALGTAAIAAFVEQRADELRNATHVEVSFARDRIALGQARLTGKADVIREDEDGLVIIDYKTGTAGDWDDKGKELTRIANRRQLLFYAILAQQSPRFAGKPVKEAKLTFVVPDGEGAIRDLVLDDLRQDEVDRVARLAQEVHGLVTSLTFPDISAYPKNADGIARFEDDILTGKFPRG